ncbi:hypothetical protein D3OALGB2SA_4910 [Olavius algarvensis associated proteobacterium Delta 3]|nr:hypothetical protein D3OALGB2SA_4910 [Olavius algarvensis associated proteobacterium Delta 3]
MSDVRCQRAIRLNRQTGKPAHGPTLRRAQGKRASGQTG